MTEILELVRSAASTARGDEDLWRLLRLIDDPASFRKRLQQLSDARSEVLQRLEDLDQRLLAAETMEKAIRQRDEILQAAHDDAERIRADAGVAAATVKQAAEREAADVRAAAEKLLADARAGHREMEARRAQLEDALGRIGQ